MLKQRGNGEQNQNFLHDKVQPKNNCVKMTGRRDFRLHLHSSSSQQQRKKIHCVCMCVCVCVRVRVCVCVCVLLHVCLFELK
jgi:hypothetical protein